jgi:hypothetical protein
MECIFSLWETSHYAGKILEKRGQIFHVGWLYLVGGDCLSPIEADIFLGKIEILVVG